MVAGLTEHVGTDSGSATEGPAPRLGPVEHRRGASCTGRAGQPCPLCSTASGPWVHREGQEVLAFCVPLRPGVAGTGFNLASLAHLKSVKAAHPLYDDAPSPGRRPPLQARPRAAAPAAPSAHPHEFLACKNNLQDVLGQARAHQPLSCGPSPFCVNCLNFAYFISKVCTASVTFLTRNTYRK